MDFANQRVGGGCFSEMRQAKLLGERQNEMEREAADTNGDGQIDAGELRLMMDRVGLSMTRDEAADLVRVFFDEQSWDSLGDAHPEAPAAAAPPAEPRW